MCILGVKMMYYYIDISSFFTNLHICSHIVLGIAGSQVNTIHQTNSDFIVDHSLNRWFNIKTIFTVYFINEIK